MTKETFLVKEQNVSVISTVAYHDVSPNISLGRISVYMHEIWPGRRAHYVKYENIIINSDLDGMSLASFAKVGQSPGACIEVASFLNGMVK